MANQGDDSRDVNDVTWVQIPEGATHIMMTQGVHSVYYYEKATMTEDLMQTADASIQTDDSFHSGNSATQTEAAKHYAIHSADASIDSATSSASEVLCQLPHRRLTSSAPDDEFKQPPGTQHEPTPKISVEELPGTQHEPTPKISVDVSINVNVSRASST